MQRKHISDRQVVAAYILSKHLCEVGEMVWPEELLQAETGATEKVCFSTMERAFNRGLVEYGTSLRLGWITDKGRELF